MSGLCAQMKKEDQRGAMRAAGGATLVLSVFAGFIWTAIYYPMIVAALLLVLCGLLLWLVVYFDLR